MQVIPTTQFYPADTQAVVQARQLFTNVDTELNRNNINNRFIVYPNPNGTHSLTISMESGFPPGAEISIYSMLGQRVMFNFLSVADVKNKRITLPINLARGIYVIKLVTRDRTYSSKFIVL